MLSQAMKPETKQQHPIAAFVLDAIWYGWCLLFAYWFFDLARNWGRQSEFMTAFGVYTGMGFFGGLVLMAWILITFRKK